MALVFCSLRLTLVLAISLVIASIGATKLMAQASDGNLVGTVLDQSGAAVSDTTIEITNAATNVKSLTTSSASGSYRFNNVPAGVYDIKFSHTGFSAAYLHGIAMTLNQTATQNITMAVGDISNVVDVTETAAVIDTTTATISATFGVREAIDVPGSVLGGGILNLSLLGAGVTNPGGVGSGDGPSVGGQRPRNNSFNIEGVTNDRRDITGHNVNVPNEAIAEFSLLQNQFSTEFGEATGGQFNIIVKSGSNATHGSLYEYLQNRNLNAMDNLNKIRGLTQKPRYDQNIFGGSIGGPIKKDKLFYYGLYQYNPTGGSPGSGNGAIFSPTAAGYAQLAAIPGVSSTNLGVLKTYLPAAAVGSKTTPICPGVPATNCNSTTSGAFNIPIGVLPVTLPNFTNAQTYLVSIDYDVSASDQIRGRFIGEKHTGFDASTLSALPEFLQRRATTAKVLAFSEFHNFSPTLLNELRLGYNRFNDDIPAGDYKFPGLNAFPNISIATDLNVQLGPFSTSPHSTVLNTFQIVDNLTLTKGRHSFKFGWDGRKFNTSSFATAFVRGEYDYTQLSQFLLDYNPDNFAIRTVGATPYNGNAINTSLFANDNFRWKSNVTFNVGLRWEYKGIPATDSQQASNAISNLPGLITFRAPTAQKTAFAPRFGVAYSPGNSGKTSIRAGFGIYYDKTFEELSSNSPMPQAATTVFAPLSGTTPGFLANGGIKGGSPCSDAASCRALTSFLIPDQQLPYAITWNLGVQHVFHNDYTVEVRYLGTKGVHLFSQDQINIFSPVNSTHFLPTYLTAPSQSTLAGLNTTLAGLQSTYPLLPPYLAAGFYNPITVFGNKGNSRYNGLALEMTRRFARNLLFKASYTWSHNIDDGTADVFSTLLSPRRPQDFQNRTAEKANSFLDRRNRFTYNWIYDLPWFAKSNSKLLRYALGGYIFSGTYTYESPQYATVQSGIDSNLNWDAASDRAIINTKGVPNTGSGVNGIDKTGHISTDPSAIVAYLAINPTAQYIVAGSGALANGGRQTMALRPINNWDVQFKKAFHPTERFQFELAAQLFNIFNHPQYVSGYINQIYPHDSTATRNNLIPDSPVFNRPDQVYSSNPRIIYLTARFQF